MDDCLAATFVAFPANVTTWTVTLTGASDASAVGAADLRAKSFWVESFSASGAFFWSVFFWGVCALCFRTLF